MKTSKKEKQFKEFKRAAERINAIYRELMNAPAKKLPKKIFAGHWRYIAVRADVLRSSVGNEVAQVVNNCNHWVLGKKKIPESYRCSTPAVFATNEGMGETNATLGVKTGAKVVVVRINGQFLNPISEEDMEKSNMSEKIKRKWFQRVVQTIPCGTKTFERITYYPKVPQHMLEFAFKPAYITEVKDANGDLESELAHLRSFMEINHGWEKIQGNHYDEWDLSLDKKKKIERLNKKETKEEIETYGN